VGTAANSRLTHILGLPALQHICDVTTCRVYTVLLSARAEVGTKACALIWGKDCVHWSPSLGSGPIGRFANALGLAHEQVTVWRVR